MDKDFSKRCLMYGPNGCGKTLYAKAMFGELGLAFFRVSYDDLLPKVFVNLENVFQEVEQYQTNAGLLLIDVEQIFAGLRSQERISVLNRIHKFDAGAPLIATTCNPDLLFVDEISLFDKIYPTYYPKAEERADIIRKICSEKEDFGKFPNPIFNKIVNETAWWSPLELKQLLKFEWNLVNTEKLQEIILHKLNKLGEVINTRRRKEENRKIIEFTLAYNGIDEIREGALMRLSDIINSDDHTKFDSNSSPLSFTYKSYDDGTDHLYLNIRSREVPEPLYKAEETETFERIVKAVSDNIDSLEVIDLSGYKITPWVAYQLGHYTQSYIDENTEEPRVSAVAMVLALTAVEAAKLCADETRIFANMLDLAAVYGRFEYLAKAIEIYQEIIDYPTHKALHERILAHISLYSLFILDGNMKEARHHFEVGARNLGLAHLSKQEKEFLMQPICKAYRQLEDPVGVCIISKEFLNSSTEDLIRDDVLDIIEHLDRTLAYTSRLNSLGYNDLANVIFESWSSKNRVQQ
ncbi:MAG: hypothetical protein DHS20C13_24130 [Thermodesulfobacteriota bacterium]|nr:MAG: hypothetical protein DHS20C13_24130 [Thermodesulfobacteriota bacterium]